jgi:hypothetical protein
MEIRIKRWAGEPGVSHSLILILILFLIILVMAGAARGTKKPTAVASRGFVV